MDCSHDGSNPGFCDPQLTGECHETATWELSDECIP
jgi:hypothetical protein